MTDWNCPSCHAQIAASEDKCFCGEERPCHHDAISTLKKGDNGDQQARHDEVMASGAASSEVGTNQNEEQRILEEVKKRKERARRSGVITSAFKLYRDDFPYYDAWATNCPRLLHPEVTVSNIMGNKLGIYRFCPIEATIRGHSYVFTFRQRTIPLPDGEEFTIGNLDVNFQGQRVMTIDCGCSDEEYTGRTWYTNDVSAFIEGPWIDELNSIFADVKHLHEEDRKRRGEQDKKEEIANLKKNFDL
jgi:hypothetical protein